jgi:hypothetical protein
VGDHYPLDRDTHCKGQLKCQDCRKQFSATVGTVVERSRIPLSKSRLAAYLLCTSKKGMSAHQLHRTLRVHTSRARRRVELPHARGEQRLRDKGRFGFLGRSCAWFPLEFSYKLLQSGMVPTVNSNAHGNHELTVVVRFLPHHWIEVISQKRDYRGYPFHDLREL